MANKVVILENNELQHYGVLGMKWGVRRTPEQLGYLPKSKKVYRVTTSSGQPKGQSGYYTTSKKEAKSFSSFVAANSHIPGVKVYLMTAKLRDVAIKPSWQEEIDTQLELLKNKKIEEIWSDTLAKNHMSQMIMSEKHQNLNELQDAVMSLSTQTAKDNWGDKYSQVYNHYKKELEIAQKAYDKDYKDYKDNRISSLKERSNEEQLRDFQIAVFGNPELREIYRQTLVNKGYNIVDDHWGQLEQRGSNNKLTSPSAFMLLDNNILTNIKKKEIRK